MGGGGTQQGSGSGLDLLNQLSQTQAQGQTSQDLSQSQYYQSLIGEQSAIGIGSGSGQPNWASAYGGSPPPQMTSLGGFDPGALSSYSGYFG